MARHQALVSIRGVPAANCAFQKQHALTFLSEEEKSVAFDTCSSVEPQSKESEIFTRFGNFEMEESSNGAEEQAQEGFLPADVQTCGDENQTYNLPKLNLPVSELEPDYGAADTEPSHNEPQQGFRDLEPSGPTHHNLINVEELPGTEPTTAAALSNPYSVNPVVCELADGALDSVQAPLPPSPLLHGTLGGNPQPTPSLAAAGHLDSPEDPQEQHQQQQQLKESPSELPVGLHERHLETNERPSDEPPPAPASVEIPNLLPSLFPHFLTKLPQPDDPESVGNDTEGEDAIDQLLNSLVHFENGGREGQTGHLVMLPVVPAKSLAPKPHTTGTSKINPQKR